MRLVVHVAFAFIYWPVHVKGSVCPAMTSRRNCGDVKGDGSGYITLSTTLTGFYAEMAEKCRKLCEQQTGPGCW